jgi:hypothetical protein
MGVKATVIANPVSSQHQSSAQQRGVSASGLQLAIQESITELIFQIKEWIKLAPQGTLQASSLIATSSPNIGIAGGSIPPWVVPGLQVVDVTTGNQVLGTVLRTAGTTLTLTANSAFAGSGSSDLLLIQDLNLPVYSGLITALQ